jgi:L-fucose isomerase-like protein
LKTCRPAGWANSGNCGRPKEPEPVEGIARGGKKSPYAEAGGRFNLSEPADQIKKSTGIEVLPVGLAELNSYYEKADDKQAAKWADKWARQAKKVVEPTREDLIKSGKMHLANSTLITERGAEAIAIDCLGGFYNGKLTAYPCLSFVELNSGELVGACEADLNSTTTMIMMRHLTGRAGMISDPVFDLPKSQIIYTHCVAPWLPAQTGRHEGPLDFKTPWHSPPYRSRRL